MHTVLWPSVAHISWYFATWWEQCDPMSFSAAVSIVLILKAFIDSLTLSLFLSPSLSLFPFLSLKICVILGTQNIWLFFYTILWCGKLLCWGIPIQLCSWIFLRISSTLWNLCQYSGVSSCPDTPKDFNKILDTDFLCIQLPQHIWSKKKDKVKGFYFPNAYLVCFPNSLGFFGQISNLKKT